MTDMFRSRVNTSVVPVAQRDPAAFKSGIAEGLQDLGGALGHAAAQDQQVKDDVAASEHRIVKIQRDRQTSAMVADRMGAWPDVQVDISNKLDDLRNSTDPGAPDYQEKADKIVTDGVTAFKDSLGGDPDVVDRFAPVIATFSASTRQGERRWAVTQKTKAEGQNVDKWGDATANGILGDPTPEKLQAAMTATDALIGALDVPPAAREAIATQKKTAFARAFLDGRLQAGDWKGVQGLMEKGTLDAYLGNDGKDKAGYLRQAQNGSEIAARQVDLAASQTRDVARDAIKAVEAKVKAGIVPTPAELRGVQSQARAAGLDQAELIDLDTLSVRTTVNRTYAGRDGASMRRDRDQLQAKMVAGTATETEQVMKKQLDDLVDAADTKETAQFRELVAQGPNGTLQALASLSGTPEARGEKAERLGKGLGLIATLGPASQNAIVHGRTIRESRPKDFGDASDARQQARATIGDGMAGQLGGRFDDVAMAAWDYMTFNVARRGGAGWDAQQFKNGMQAALGATLRPNGALQGGVQRVRGSNVWLPETMTAPEFDTQLARTDFAGAVYAGGAAVDKNDVLTNYHPVYVSDDDNGVPIYYLYDRAGGVLNRKDGRPFSVRPRIR